MRVSLAARVAAAGELELLALCSGSLPLPDLARRLFIVFIINNEGGGYINS